MHVDCGDDILAVSSILQNSPHVTHLTFDVCEVNNSPAIFSLMKTALYASSVRRLDWECDYLIHVFDDLAHWTDIPQQDPSCKKETLIQELNLSAVELSELQTMPNLVMFLQLHLPKLKSLSLDGVTFSYNSAIIFTAWLRAKQDSLEKLSLTCSHMDTDVVPWIFGSLHNQSTLRKFQMEIRSAHFRCLGCVIRNVTEAVRVCQLQSLRLDIFVDHRVSDDTYSENVLSVMEEEGSNLDDDAEKDSNPDYAAFVQAFATNVTLSDVHFSDKIIENMPTGDAEKIYFYAKRNKEFQMITSNLTLGAMDRKDNNGSRSSGGVGGDDDDSVSTTTIPLGLWPHILEAAHKHFPDLSMLRHLLSSQTVGLLLAGRGENDHDSARCTTITITNKDAQKMLS
jgi:hypothetical protein